MGAGDLLPHPLAKAAALDGRADTGVNPEVAEALVSEREESAESSSDCGAAKLDVGP